MKLTGLSVASLLAFVSMAVSVDDRKEPSCCSSGVLAVTDRRCRPSMLVGGGPGNSCDWSCFEGVVRSRGSPCLEGGADALDEGKLSDCQPGTSCLIDCGQGPLEGRSCHAVHGQCVSKYEAAAAERSPANSAIAVSGWESDQLRWAPRCGREGEDPAVGRSAKGGGGKGGGEGQGGGGDRACHCEPAGCRDARDGHGARWCYLQKVADPKQPVHGCYADVLWWPEEGRFYSKEACAKSPSP